MIQGLRLKVTSPELKTHCQARAAYHEGRAKTKEAELPKLKEAMEHIRGATTGLPSSVTHMNKGGYNLDPNQAVTDLENDVREHKNKAMVFAYFAEHLFAEDYDLQEADLRRLEIVK